MDPIMLAAGVATGAVLTFLIRRSGYWAGFVAGQARERKEGQTTIGDLRSKIADLRGQLSDRPETPRKPPICPHSNAEVEGGCQWEARYETGASTLDLSKYDDDQLEKIMDGVNLDQVAEKYRAETYVRDVCVKCGRTAGRETRSASEASYPTSRMAEVNGAGMMG